MLQNTETFENDYMKKFILFALTILTMLHSCCSVQKYRNKCGIIITEEPVENLVISYLSKNDSIAKVKCDYNVLSIDTIGKGEKLVVVINRPSCQRIDEQQKDGNVYGGSAEITFEIEMKTKKVTDISIDNY